MLFGGIEAGGTKISLCVGKDGEVDEKITIPTKTPKETLPLIVDFFKKHNEKDALKGIGIACFGPVDAHPTSSNYGTILATPKLDWKNYPLRKELKKHFSMPIYLDTDVNGAAFGEYKYGAAKDLDTFLYMTVGTGIGVGAIISHNMLHGLLHAEMGHMIVPKRDDDNFEGVCPYHKNCLEALASGPSMCKRWDVKQATDLPSDHKAWDLEAYYLGIGITNMILCTSPQKIIIGGGVMFHSELFPMIRKYVKDFLGGYISHKKILENIDEYIVPPALEDQSGIIGALALAEKAYMDETQNQAGRIYERPWGSYETLKMQPKAQVKWIKIKPKHKLSLQKHKKRSENWVVVKGHPTITVGENVKEYSPTEMIFIPIDAKHRIENNKDEEAIVVEVQTGDYLGEDDIIRLEDKYGRAT